MPPLPTLAARVVTLLALFSATAPPEVTAMVPAVIDPDDCEMVPPALSFRSPVPALTLAPKNMEPPVDSSARLELTDTALPIDRLPFWAVRDKPLPPA